MGVLDVIRAFAAPAAPSPAVTPAQPGNPTLVDGNKTVPNSTTIQSDGTQPAIPAAKVGDASPLDAYKDLWQVDTSKSGIPSSLVPPITIDPTKLMDAARKIDFTANIPPDLLQKASKGNDPVSLAQLINLAAQNAYAQGAAATLTVTKAAMTEQEGNFNKMLPDLMRKHHISTEVSKDNPLFTNPATAPLLSALEQQFTAKFPQASATEIKKHAQEYFTGMAEAIITANGGTVVKNDVTSQAQSAQDTDWGKYFGVDVAA